MFIRFRVTNLYSIDDSDKTLYEESTIPIPSDLPGHHSRLNKYFLFFLVPV